MSNKRYILNLKNGNIEDVGAESISFTPTHIAFYTYAPTEHITRTLEYAIRAELVDTIIEESE